MGCTWVAMDADMKWWGYKTKPALEESLGAWAQNTQNTLPLDVLYIGTTANLDEDWRWTLFNTGSMNDSFKAVRYGR